MMKYNSGLYHLPLPLPCYVMEEDLLRNNLQLIKDISQKADVQFILAFKAFALWKSFPIFREYIKQTTASSPYEARLAFEEFGSKAHTYSPAYEDSTFDVILKCVGKHRNYSRNDNADEILRCQVARHQANQ